MERLKKINGGEAFAVPAVQLEAGCTLLLPPIGAAG